MGFLSGLEAVGAGIAEQGIQNYQNVGAQQAAMMADAQKRTDAVAAKQNQIDEQADKINQISKSYELQYGIPSDMAYSVASDPAIQAGIAKDPDKLGAYISRLKAVPGKTMPAQPDTQVQPPQPGVHKDYGIMGGGSFTIPPVPGVMSRGQPERQVYSPEGEPNMPFPPATDQQTRAAQQTINQLNSAGKPIPPELWKQAYGGEQPTANENIDRRDQRINDVVKLAQQGMPKALAVSSYVAKGGNAHDLDGIDLDGMAKHAQQTPDYQAKVSAAQTALASAFHMTRAQVLPYAQLLAAGIIHPVTDATGAFKGMYNNATSSFVDPSAEPAVIKAMAATNSVNGGQQSTIPGQPGTQHTTVAPPPPVASQTTTTPAQPIAPMEFFKPHPPAWMPPKDYNSAYYNATEVPKINMNINYALALVHNDPSAVGIKGMLAKHLGGPLENVTSMISPTISNYVESMVGVADKKAMETSLELLDMSLKRYVAGANSPNNSAGMGVGGQQALEEFNSIFEHQEIHATPQALEASLHTVLAQFNNSYTADMISIGAVPNMGDVKLRSQAQQILISQGFSPNMAVQITKSWQQRQAATQPGTPK